MNHQAIFEKICLFNQINKQQVQFHILQLAKTLMRTDDIPHLDNLTDVALLRGLYLLDALNSLLPLPLEKHVKINRILQNTPLAKNINSTVTFYPNDKKGPDQIAQKWGLANGMRPASMKALLDLQRRVNSIENTKDSTI